MDLPSNAGAKSDNAEAALAYDGKLAELTRIFLINLALTIVTFGVFHFWAITRMRRYLWSHTRFEGTPFRYTGEAKDLLQGFLLAMLTLVLLFAGAAVAAHLLRRSDPAHALLPYAPATVGTLVLFGASRFAALRYRLRHTEWRGVTGGMDGTALRYGANWMIYLLLCVATAAQATPWMQINLARWRIDASHFGSATFHCEGRGRQLYLSWLALIIGHVVLIGVIAAIIAGFEGPWLAHVVFGRSKLPAAHDMAFQATPAIIGGLAIIVGSAMLAISYQAKRLRLVLTTTTAVVRGRFRNELLGFDMTAEVDSLSWMGFTNLVILVLTLGLGVPLVLHRNARFLAQAIRVTGDFEANTLAQAAVTPATVQNGYLHTLDPGVV